MKTNKSKSAFTIIELMISIVLLAMILSAVSLAFDACISNYQANKDISDAVIKANQALSRITNDLRCAVAVDTSSEPNNQCALITAEGKDITYRFDNNARRIYLIENNTGVSHVLCDDISSAYFEKTTEVDVFGNRLVKNVQITLTIGSGNGVQKACAAVAIRRNL